MPPVSIPGLQGEETRAAMGGTLGVSEADAPSATCQQLQPDCDVREGRRDPSRCGRGKRHRESLLSLNRPALSQGVTGGTGLLSWAEVTHARRGPRLPQMSTNALARWQRPEVRAAEQART